MASPALRLVIDKGPSAGTEVALANGTVTIGRGPGADLVLQGDEFVSARHARVVCAGGRATLSNQSPNGTLVNGLSVTQVTLAAGDVISIGVMHLVAVREAAGATARAAGSSGSTAKPPIAGGTQAHARTRMPAWLIAYLGLMAGAFVFFAVVRLTGAGAPGIEEVRAQEEQYATAQKFPQQETDLVLRLLDTAVVHERRGDFRSAYEAYREAMSVRRPIDARSPVYRYAASRGAAIGPR